MNNSDPFWLEPSLRAEVRLLLFSRLKEECDRVLEFSDPEKTALEATKQVFEKTKPPPLAPGVTRSAKDWVNLLFSQVDWDGFVFEAERLAWWEEIRENLVARADADGEGTSADLQKRTRWIRRQIGDLRLNAAPWIEKFKPTRPETRLSRQEKRRLTQAKADGLWKIVQEQEAAGPERGRRGSTKAESKSWNSEDDRRLVEVCLCNLRHHDDTKDKAEREALLLQVSECEGVFRLRAKEVIQLKLSALTSQTGVGAIQIEIWTDEVLNLAFDPQPEKAEVAAGPAKTPGDQAVVPDSANAPTSAASVTPGTSNQGQEDPTSPEKNLKPACQTEFRKLCKKFDASKGSFRNYLTYKLHKWCLDVIRSRKIDAADSSTSYPLDIDEDELERGEAGVFPINLVEGGLSSPALPPLEMHELPAELKISRNQILLDLFLKLRIHPYDFENVTISKLTGHTDEPWRVQERDEFHKSDVCKSMISEHQEACAKRGKLEADLSKYYEQVKKLQRELECLKSELQENGLSALALKGMELHGNGIAKKKKIEDLKTEIEQARKNGVVLGDPMHLSKLEYILLNAQNARLNEVRSDALGKFRRMTQHDGKDWTRSQSEIAPLVCLDQSNVGRAVKVNGGYLRPFMGDWLLFKDQSRLKREGN